MKAGIHPEDYRLPPLEDYPHSEPYCTRCKLPVKRGRDDLGRLAHRGAGAAYEDDDHPVELGWRPRDNAQAVTR